MRIIGCGDIHMSTAKLSSIPDVKNIDAFIVNGDLTNFGHAKECAQVIAHFSAITPAVYAQIGNLDHADIDDWLNTHALNLHGRAYLHENHICLTGLGGSNKTPFATPSEFSEQELFTIGKKSLTAAHHICSVFQAKHRKRLPILFITHTPPCNTNVDRISTGAHVGSPAVRSLIEEFQPDLCISGHIHEAEGQDQIGNTPLINPGMLSKGGYIDLHIANGTIKAKKCKIL